MITSHVVLLLWIPNIITGSIILESATIEPPWFGPFEFKVSSPSIRQRQYLQQLDICIRVFGRILTYSLENTNVPEPCQLTYLLLYFQVLSARVIASQLLRFALHSLALSSQLQRHCLGGMIHLLQSVT